MGNSKNFNHINSLVWMPWSGILPLLKNKKQFVAFLTFPRYSVVKEICNNQWWTVNLFIRFPYCNNNMLLYRVNLTKTLKFPSQKWTQDKMDYCNMLCSRFSHEVDKNLKWINEKTNNPSISIILIKKDFQRYLT